MNNWLTTVLAQEKQMPLPVSPPMPEKNWSSGARLLDGLMTQETADLIKHKNPQMGWLGSGAEGVANECRPGVVCKFTMEEEEVKVAQKVMNNPNPFVAEVFSVRLIQGAPNKIWMIEMSKLVPLSIDEKRIYGTVESYLNTDIEERISEVTYNRQIEMLGDNFNGLSNGINPETINLIYQKTQEMLNGLKQAGIGTSDTHADNVGWNRHGNLALFDFGSTGNY